MVHIFPPLGALLSALLGGSGFCSILMGHIVSGMRVHLHIVFDINSGREGIIEMACIQIVLFKWNVKIAQPMPHMVEFDCLALPLCLTVYSTLFVLVGTLIA